MVATLPSGETVGKETFAATALLIRSRRCAEAGSGIFPPLLALLMPEEID